MTTKTMMQLAWDNWHADMAPDDIPGINPSFKEGWERCAELHAGIDMDKLNADLVGCREQIDRLQYEVDAIPEIKAERDEWKARCEFSFKQRDALKDAARLALEEAAMAAEDGFKYALDGYQIADKIRSLK